MMGGPRILSTAQEGMDMVFVPNEKLKKKMLSMDGSVLKYMHSVAGGGKGLVAGGAVLLFFCVLLAVLIVPGMKFGTGLMVCICLCLPGLLMVVGGRFMQKRRMNNWLKTVAKRTGYSEEEIRRIDEEFKQPGTVLFSYTKGKDTNSLKKMGFITAHYVRFPGVGYDIYHLQELAACLYTENYIHGNGEHDRAMVAYAMDKPEVYQCYGLEKSSKKACTEIVEAIEARNPLVITAHQFSYEGKNYDAVQGRQEVLELQRRLRSQQ